MRRLVPFPTAFSLSSHRTALEQANARVLRRLGASIWVRIWCYLTINLQTHGDPIFTWFYTPSHGWTSASQLSETPVFFHPPPHPRHLDDVTEMVVTAVAACQLNTTRRILAEIKLRINGFNAYG